MSLGIILYGPPASGKSSVAQALADEVPGCRLFRRIKVGGRPKPEYRNMTMQQFRVLERRGDILWSNQRYRATYAVDRPELLNELGDGIPVLALGQVPAVLAVTEGTSGESWLAVELWCPRDETERRLKARDPQDVQERLAAWDATERLPSADLHIDTDEVDVGQAIARIRRAIEHSRA